jgi:hypothetical protein
MHNVRGATNPLEHKMIQVHDCVREKVTHFYERHIYGSCRPLNHLWTSSQHDLTFISKGNTNGGLVKD